MDRVDDLRGSTEVRALNGPRTTQFEITFELGDERYGAIGEAVRHEHDANDPITGVLLAAGEAAARLAHQLKRAGWSRVKAADEKFAAGSIRMLAAIEAHAQNEVARGIRAETAHLDHCTGEHLIAHLVSTSEAGRGHGISQVRGISVAHADEQDRIRAHRRAHGKRVKA
jgi:hypothetical protein